MSIQSFINAARADGQKIERLIRRFYEGLPRRSVFVDGGAHVGYHTEHAMRHFEMVVAVEASPVTYIAHLRTRIAEAIGPAALNVVPINSALGCRQRQGDTIDFFFSEEHPGRSTVNTKLWDSWAPGAVRYEHAIRASVVEIDDIRALFARGRRVDFIKLDLEGNEIHALRGGADTLRTDRPAVVMELGLKPSNEAIFGETCAGFIDLMHSQGYALFAPWAERAEESIMKGYPFWYAFALPQGDQMDHLVARLKNCFDAQSL
jgi:FkbM family methyltransferase